MASLPTSPDQEQQGSQANNPLSVAPAGGGATAGAKNVSSPSQAAAGAPGTPATNVGAYLAANAPATQNFANTITGNLNTQYGQTQADIGAAGTNFNNQVNASYTPQNAQLVNNANANPTAFVQTPGNVDAFKAQLNDQYTGPGEFETSQPYSNVQNEIATAQDAAAPWQSFAGTEAQFRGLGDNTPGEQALDATLFQQTPGVATQIQGAAQPFSTLTDYLNSLSPQANQNVRTAQNNAAAAAAAAQGVIQGQNKTLETNVNNSLASNQFGYDKAKQNYNAMYSTLSSPMQNVLTSFLLGNKVDPRIAAALGDISSFDTANPDAAVSLPVGTKYLQNVPTFTPPTAASSVTPDEVALSNALVALSGGSVNPGYTTAGTYQLPSAPSINQGAIAGDAYSAWSNLEPTKGWTAPNAVSTYQDALNNLMSYLQIPINGGPPPVPPPTDGGGGIHSGGPGSGGGTGVGGFGGV